MSAAPARPLSVGGALPPLVINDKLKLMDNKAFKKTIMDFRKDPKNADQFCGVDGNKVRLAGGVACVPAGVPRVLRSRIFEAVTARSCAGVRALHDAAAAPPCRLRRSWSFPTRS